MGAKKKTLYLPTDLANWLEREYKKGDRNRAIVTGLELYRALKLLDVARPLINDIEGLLDYKKGGRRNLLNAWLANRDRLMLERLASQESFDWDDGGGKQAAT